MRVMMIKDIKYGEIQELRKRLEAEGLTIGEGKRIMRDFRDKHNLTDKETLDLANCRI